MGQNSMPSIKLSLQRKSRIQVLFDLLFVNLMLSIIYSLASAPQAAQLELYIKAVGPW
jgi:hypothetical protein